MPEALSITKQTSIILATRNQGKIRELAGLMRPFNLQVFGLDDFPDVPEIEETGETFAENALLKACGVSRATGLVAVADDSGLEVDALGKAPGIFSARYSQTPEAAATDAGNIEKLLAELRGVEHREGRFRCCIAACTPSGEHLLAEGAWEGCITKSPAGSNGFGYDPVFFDKEKNCTAAEMSREEKNSRSHRARAVAALLGQWGAFWQTWLKRKR